ncbi:unnamed protein product [Kluyveromyces dobzhanskii CBS 2104]|uniref:WGS project CCBQ000000000 data, contig 00041 n=1 Tax=Kluyveromyces dobzhanskii CBS 2104 TaxID=1427455 RepID=A0A0A8L051_9SACH|nr:unnamed protein product [Kluyveromyces dobzhanskii CBS 2104]
MPLFLGEFQFIFIALSACVTCYIGYYVPSVQKIFPEGIFPKYTGPDTSVILRPNKDVLYTVFPLGLFQFLGKYYGHRATSLVPVSTVASIKTLSPIFIILAQKLLKRNDLRLNKAVYLSLACVMLGVWVIVYSDAKNVVPKNSGSGLDEGTVRSNHYGVLFANVSMLIFVAQNIYAKNIFTFRSNELPTTNNYNALCQKTSPKKYDKLTLMMYISSVGFLLSLGWFVTLELPTLWGNFFNEPHKIEIPWRLIMLNGALHFLQSMITFYLIGEISTLSYSIANIMKRIAIISFSWVYTSHNITPIQILGMLLNVTGIFFYKRLMKFKNTE